MLDIVITLIRFPVYKIDNTCIWFFFGKTAQPNETKLVRDGLWEKEIQIYVNEVDPLLVELLRYIKCKIM